MQLRARPSLGVRRIRAVAAVRALSKPAGRSHSTSRVPTDQQGPAGEAVRTAVSAPGRSGTTRLSEQDRACEPATHVARLRSERNTRAVRIADRGGPPGEPAEPVTYGQFAGEQARIIRRGGGWSGLGLGGTRNVDHVWHVLQRWADWVYTVGTRASCGRCVRSATRTVPVVDRQQRDRQQAHPVRGPRGACRRRHTDSAPQGCAAEQRAWSESSFERAVQDMRAVQQPHIDTSSRFTMSS